MQPDLPARDSPRKRTPGSCPDCGGQLQNNLLREYRTQARHDGREIELHVDDLPVLTCAGCDKNLFGRAANDIIDQALREAVGVLSPELIRESRKQLGMTQEGLAHALGTASATISRWESGAVIQSKSLDRFLRVYFTFPEVREFLTNGATARTGGARVSLVEGVKEAVAQYLVMEGKPKGKPMRGRLTVYELLREFEWWEKKEESRAVVACWIAAGLSSEEAARLKPAIEDTRSAALGEASSPEEALEQGWTTTFLAWALISGSTERIREASRRGLDAGELPPWRRICFQYARDHADRLAEIGKRVVDGWLPR